MTTRYTAEHEYIRVEGAAGTVGISDFAQNQLGDIVYVELPSVGQKLKKGDQAAVVESVKAASEIYAPVTGTVTEVNSDLSGDPGLINRAPADDGWIFKMTVETAGELDTLMDGTAYAAHAA